MLLYDSQATNISLMSALSLSTRISDTEDGRACHELCVVETVYMSLSSHITSGQGASNSRNIQVARMQPQLPS